MLSMIQRVFYCDLGPASAKIDARDLDAREHLALWPMVALFLAMGIASPLWLRSIDTFGTPAAGARVQFGVPDRHCDIHPCQVELTAGAAKEAR
jgi:hypothetical protein